MSSTRRRNGGLPTRFDAKASSSLKVSRYDAMVCELAPSCDKSRSVKKRWTSAGKLAEVTVHSPEQPARGAR